jgi:hypothetical protein
MGRRANDTHIYQGDSEMNVKVTLEAIITLPEGTQLPTQGRGFTLPNGDWVKPFVVLERNDWQDLSTTEAESLGIDITEGQCTIEAEEAE